MKKRIINLTIGLTGLVASFLPQKAEADWCSVECPNGSCSAVGPVVQCGCTTDGYPICDAS